MTISKNLQGLKEKVESRGWMAQFDKYGNLEGWFNGIHFLYGDDNGCGVIDKPNGTNKWYYDKSCNQFNGILKAVEECNQYR